MLQCSKIHRESLPIPSMLPITQALSVSCSHVQGGLLALVSGAEAAFRCQALFFGMSWMGEGGTLGKHLNSAVI